MKKITFLFIIIFILLFSLAFKKNTINSFPLFGKTFVIDPGHGGIDPGAVYGDKVEKDYNLDFSNVLKHELESLGASVIMTRNADYDLSASEKHRKKSDFDNRILLIDAIKPDLYISLHMNYLKETKYYGAQVFYSDINSSNKVIANDIQEKLNKFLSLNKKIKKIPNEKYMYNKIKSKGVLIEFAFISNTKDRENLNKEEYKTNLANVIISGIEDYLM